MTILNARPNAPKIMKHSLSGIFGIFWLTSWYSSRPVKVRKPVSQNEVPILRSVECAHTEKQMNSP